MVNDPRSEPYFARLIDLGYRPFTYSEKHYLFVKGRSVIKIARSKYNDPKTDGSYYIEARAHDILSEHGFAVAKINRIYEKGELVDGFVVLEEGKIDGQVFYQKDSDEGILKQILGYMTNASDIKGQAFGMMDRYGEAQYSSWSDFLISVISKVDVCEREMLLSELVHLPKDTKPSFVFTDCNTANFIFGSGKLKCAVDVERPLWGDRDFLFGMIKYRNPYMFDLAVKSGRIKNKRLIDLYGNLYKFIFE